MQKCKNETKKVRYVNTFLLTGDHLVTNLGPQSTQEPSWV